MSETERGLAGFISINVGEQAEDGFASKNSLNLKRGHF
jgi:hypothetical protein